MKSRINAIIDALFPLFSTLAALLVGTIMMVFLDVNPITAYRAIITGAFGNANAVAETLV